MKIDLHIHSKNGSDGRWDIRDIFAEASRRGIEVISITDHDSIDAQEQAQLLAKEYGMRFVTGVELNISFSHPGFRSGKAVSLDVLGYGFDYRNTALKEKLSQLRSHRIERAGRILENLNTEFRAQGLPEFTGRDMEAIQAGADGALARPHIAAYLIEKGIVRDKQEAFDRYLVKCDVPKMPLSLEEASSLVRGAGGRLVLAHPGDPNGTSLVALTDSLEKQLEIIRETMLDFIDGIECWHSRHDKAHVSAYLDFTRQNSLMATGGSDCHQQPPVMGTAQVPGWVAGQFDF
ncbi:MAG: PHP domain-containing protein [Desulfomonilia bacterium]|uniref:DNA polymerase III PolC n=1 Tax=anaerobic digester metagenome TaxID=1263854 RepID=A0A485M2U9_9ZZZZ|nr:PHP domain-containing protein [Pseudomonadota bacterium]HON38657.1 PHP domain-containing protein [Deltaproteobacteria bacterium]HRS55961.1 PHP domain-containing protein [Desulfomonilia bacterium]HPD21865.1 PHP domain-containing protein [Deltaproteobacteria bacterium]HPX17876.1 PHP domain-containing protein [Deltaproteobacteria bacterium]